MPIVYHQGNVFDSKARVIFQGCNCQNKMGSGMAREMATRYPEAAQADLRTLRGDVKKLGTFSYAFSKTDNRILFNLYSQNFYGTDRRHLDYVALTDSLRAMRASLIKMNILDTEMVASGRIGAGLAGGDWTIIEEIIEKVFYDRTIHIYDLK